MIERTFKSMGLRSSRRLRPTPQSRGLARGLFTACALAVLATQSALAATYEVGPGKTYSSIGAVPWSSVSAGDTVRIFHKSTPYFEKMLLSQSGTASLPITVEGVPGAAGELPIIDGLGATTSSNFAYAFTSQQDRGLLTISTDSSRPSGYKPKYLVVRNLAFRNARTPNSYIARDGTTRAYVNNTAGVFIERGENITIQNCAITANGNGLFVASGDSESLMSREVLVEGCYIYENGNVGRDREHNCYTEAAGMVFQYNRFGKLRSGAGGNTIKDRSAGTVIRYNWIEGGTQMMDLVEPEYSYLIMTADSRWPNTFVYGNIVVNTAGDGNRIIHFGGDQGNEPFYRPNLYFYNNTVVVRRNQSEAWRVMLFRCESNGQRVDARNNILYYSSLTAGTESTEFSLMDAFGHATFGVNWVSPGYLNWRSGTSPSGTVTGTASFLTNTQNNPGFQDLAARNFHLRSDSAALDRSGDLHAAAGSTYDVTREYVEHQMNKLRQISGTARDLGAFEEGAGGQYTLAARPASVNTGDTIFVDWNAPPSSSSTDWIGLFKVGAADTAFSWSNATGGAASGTFSTAAPSEPGSYEFRYFLNGGSTKVATSNPITVVQPQVYTLTPSATTVTPGAAMTISWTAPAGRPGTDWIGLFRVGGIDSSYIWWRYTGGAAAGTLNLNAPMEAGSYEFRYYLNNGFTLGVRSATVVVDAGGGGGTHSVTSSASSVAPGGALSVSWTAPAGSSGRDWISLFKVGDPNTAYGWWSYTGGALSGTFNLTAPLATGQYEFRYLLDNGYTSVAKSGAITVGSAYGLSASPSTVSTGGTITVQWTAPAGSAVRDWISIFKVGAPNTAYGEWKYTGGATSGTFTFTAPSAGQYEFRYLLDNGFTSTAKSNVVTVN